ncbi:hypothetical protein JZ751_008551 [Albula glossodonta]|uniref:Uncharacterized protein n=1 Tax=Albula glossodonta TaxID=121402 RepID=A0A8T2N945_9TELE|nr:hypothetical protein JZ751_008551 [Albula glossodonta]
MSSALCSSLQAQIDHYIALVSTQVKDIVGNGRRSKKLKSSRWRARLWGERLCEGGVGHREGGAGTEHAQSGPVQEQAPSMLSLGQYRSRHRACSVWASTGAGTEHAQSGPVQDCLLKLWKNTFTVINFEKIPCCLSVDPARCTVGLSMSELLLHRGPQHE